MLTKKQWYSIYRKIKLGMTDNLDNADTADNKFTVSLV